MAVHKPPRMDAVSVCGLILDRPASSHAQELIYQAGTAEWVWSSSVAAQEFDSVLLTQII